MAAEFETQLDEIDIQLGLRCDKAGGISETIGTDGILHLLVVLLEEGLQIEELL